VAPARRFRDNACTRQLSGGEVLAPMPIRSDRALRALDALKYEYGPGVGDAKREALQAAWAVRLRTAPQVRALHEVLCFWRAYPDDRALLSEVERLLAVFGRRPDVRRHHEVLLNSGISGTDIVYPFSRVTTRWIAERWGDRLSIEWSVLEDEDRLTRALILYALPAEVPGLDEAPLPARPWVERLRAPLSSGAAYLAARAASFPAPEWARDRLYEELGVSCRLRGGDATPSRTLAKAGRARVVFRRRPLRRERPDLVAEALRPPRAIEPVGRRAAVELISLARGAMITRERDLDAFMWADPRDVRLVDCGDGLQFACIGVLPERRFVLESVYGFLTLQNGVPIGYALASALMGFSEIAYNVFETFRGGEAAHVFGRLLATVRAIFGASEFTIDPYQLGHHNDEGLESGAWWFYYKLGFRPRASAAKALVRRELARLAHNRSYRTPVSTLAKIVPHPVYLELEARRDDDLVEKLNLTRIGLAVTGYVTSRFGADRERAAAVCADEAAQLLGVGRWRSLPRNERDAWTRWGPLVAVLPGVNGWSADERRALADAIRAKGGVRESEFVHRVDAHTPLRRALIALSRGLSAFSR
jgi:hypothetical protein